VKGSLKVGYPEPNFDKQSTPTERYCKQCRGWYAGKLSACPDCETARPALNPHIRKAWLDNHLYKSAGLRK